MALLHTQLNIWGSAPPPCPPSDYAYGVWILSFRRHIRLAPAPSSARTMPTMSKHSKHENYLKIPAAQYTYTKQRVYSSVLLRLGRRQREIDKPSNIDISDRAVKL